MTKIWFDLTNTPHVNFFKPIIMRYAEYCNTIVSARDFAETIELARRELQREPIIIGRHGGKSIAKKLYYTINRMLAMLFTIPHFDVLMTCGGAEASFVAKIRRKRAIIFDDNDISPNWMYSRFIDHAFFPKAISIEVLLKQGFKPERIHQYDGYKEDIYIADYEPDHHFCKNLPFKEYVLVRPENVMASYMNKNCRSIVPELLRALVKKRYNVLYLPRYQSDRLYAQDVKEVYIPSSPVNGLDASYFSYAVLSGAGTLSREAACLGRPAVSFYAGKRLLAVDQQMVSDGWIFHSRRVSDIIEYVDKSKSRKTSVERSQKVQRNVFHNLDSIMNIC